MISPTLICFSRNGSGQIIVKTRQTTPGLDVKAKTKGAMAYMQKPIDKQILLDTVEQVVRESECTQAKRT